MNEKIVKIKKWVAPLFLSVCFLITMCVITGSEKTLQIGSPIPPNKEYIICNFYRSALSNSLYCGSKNVPTTFEELERKGWVLYRGGEYLNNPKVYEVSLIYIR